MSAPPGRPAPVLRGARVTLRPPAPADSEVARRIGLHPLIVLGYGEVLDEWRDDVIMRLDADRWRALRPSWTAGGDYPEL